MVSKNIKSIKLFSASSRTFGLMSLCLCAMLFFSCQSILVVDVADDSLPLDTGAAVYLIADVKKARPILDILPIKELSEKRTAQMLEKTNYLAAGFFPKENERHFQIFARGNYPSFGARMALGSNKSWKKQRAESGYSFWYSEANGLSLAMNSRQAYVVSSTDPYEPVPASGGISFPEDFAEFANTAPLSLWLDDPAPLIYQIINEIGIPIRFPVQQLFVNLYPLAEDGEGICEAIIRLQFESASQARGVAAILSLASAYIPADFSLGAIFLANPPVQNDNNVDIKTARLTENDLKILLALLF